MVGKSAKPCQGGRSARAAAPVPTPGAAGEQGGGVREPSSTRPGRRTPSSCRALDHPSVGAQSCAVPGAAACDGRHAGDRRPPRGVRGYTVGEAYGLLLIFPGDPEMAEGAPPCLRCRALLVTAPGQPDRHPPTETIYPAICLPYRGACTALRDGFGHRRRRRGPDQRLTRSRAARLTVNARAADPASQAMPCSDTPAAPREC